MSIAGIRSNRGDGYQTLVAIDWALFVLSDPDFEWIEVDSINYFVDDVVVGRSDGSIIACQCKKNHPEFKSWTMSDLGDELDKAFQLLAINPKVNVRFYSRNNFGDLAKLKEHSTSQSDESSYIKSLGIAHTKLNSTLASRIQKVTSNLDEFEFLCRTNFVTTDDLDQMERQLLERLRNMVSNHQHAFHALWLSIERLGARLGGGSSSTAAMHRLTKNELLNIVQQAGSILVPPIEIAELRHSFSSTSAIGRSWQRDIAGQRIESPILDELLTAIEAEKSSILLTGLPGSGKTCIMLELQEVLENRSDIVPLFIQSREFADFDTLEERHAQGLTQLWVEKAARLAESTRVVVIIDSLDVLSIAREHRVLQYFLAQIDRLLLIPSITVVTACRDFDRHYDRRIAERNWDCELKCQPLKWVSNIAPLLDSLGIEAANIDAATRELISNPRELALYVELALRDGGFSVVTSQALGQRYLNKIVLADSDLGDAAIIAIEVLATEMLHLRSLTVPHQRFQASYNIQRKLCSLNILQQSQDGKLTFGHQTLMDALVISQALRSGITLNEFINSLSPVPFVRPSIRCFIAQLNLGDRRQFRKQLRTVLMGSAAFHIRRLAAESFTEHPPQDDDWSMLRELHDKHLDVFQVIYFTGASVDWHHFWMKFLVPHLITTKNSDGLLKHIHRVTMWVNLDTAGVVEFWMNSLALSWFDSNEVEYQLAIHLSQIEEKNQILAAPLLKKLLTKQRADYGSLGRVFANCVSAGVLSDAELWAYITEALTDDDLKEYKFDHKLRCKYDEFGSQTHEFLSGRMQQSSGLLGLALEAIEHWSRVRVLRYNNEYLGYQEEFLRDTSYGRKHSPRVMHSPNSLSVLLDAVETGIIFNAKSHSQWWQKNRERLCFNSEGALVYMAVLACKESVDKNTDLIGRMLCDRNMLEFQLTYELSELISVAFTSLSDVVQDAVMETIININSQIGPGESTTWRLYSQAEFIFSIPSYLRSPALQMVMDEYYQKSVMELGRPKVFPNSGFVRPPFSYKVFVEVSDAGVLKLLNHYRNNIDRNDIDFLIGGVREVGGELQTAVSLQPSRFLSLLSINWSLIPGHFRDNLLCGVARYLNYRYGNLSPNGEWNPLEEPDAHYLAVQILDELEKHPTHWQRQAATAEVLEACANVIQDDKTVERLVLLGNDFAELDEERSLVGNSRDLITTGINMIQGKVIEAFMILANNLLENGYSLPPILVSAIHRFAIQEHPALRALLLRHLPFVQYKSFELGWEIFHLTMQDSLGLWQYAEPCLYHAYSSHFKVIEPFLKEIRLSGSEEDFQTWGRISALSALSGHINFEDLIRELNKLDLSEAWLGATTVWTNIDNLQQHREQCLSGIERGLNTRKEHSIVVAQQVDQIFNDKEGVILIPETIVQLCFSAFKKDCSETEKYHRLFSFDEWLNAISQQFPDQALTSTEIYLDYVRYSGQLMYDHNSNLTQLMTRLFTEAEEREESDNGTMLQRVVALQDKLLSIGVQGIDKWLKAAERP
ncbi:ATP-binding protein [Pantoea sp. R102]|uniref:AAA family ATPase n=1 Tax=Pantoea sp. R102 TaxID=2507583 RepID=UPI0010A85BB1|nr:ATP-binding protein [Pantoea sp. R102]THD38657.1 ATP-binding protein [Pantoea sp. R102]